MRSIIKLSTLLVFLSLAGETFSQFSIAGHGSYIKFFERTEISNIGGGIKLEYEIDEKSVGYLGLNYFLPCTKSGSTGAYALSNMVTPGYIEVETEHVITIMHMTFGARRYFIGDDYSEAAFYGLGEAGILMANYKINVTENFEEGLYEVPEEETGKNTLQNFTVNLGLGLDFAVAFGSVFAETKICFPADEVNGEQVQTSIPASWCTNLGVRYKFGQGSTNSYGKKSKGKSHKRGKSRRPSNRRR